MSCSYCGSPLEPDALFCTNCGARVASAEQALSSTPTPAALAPTAPTAPPTAGRPLVLVLICLYALFTGTGYLLLSPLLQLVGLSAGFAEQVADALGTNVLGSAISLRIALLSWFTYLLGALMIAAAYGVWSMLLWGRSLMILVSAANAVLGIFLFVILPLPGEAPWFSLIMNLLISVGIIFWLSQPSTRPLFQ